MTIEITPYSEFGKLRFDKTTKDECIRLMGNPAKKRMNRGGVEEYDYEQFIVRFHPKTLSVQECTLLPFADAIIDGIAVTWNKEFLRMVCEKDQDPRESYGFIVLFRMGIALTGIHDDDESQLSVTAFAKGLFDDLLPLSRQFDFS